MNAAFCLGSAAPAARASVFIRRGPAAARHTPNREITGCDKWMRRQFGQLVDRLDLFARDVGERVELQPDTILFHDRDFGAGAALEALTPIDPGREWF